MEPPKQDWYRAEQELCGAAESQPRAKRSPVAESEPKSSGAGRVNESRFY